jgi:hypothetical protein
MNKEQWDSLKAGDTLLGSDEVTYVLDEYVKTNTPRGGKGWTWEGRDVDYQWLFVIQNYDLVRRAFEVGDIVGGSMGRKHKVISVVVGNIGCKGCYLLDIEPVLGGAVIYRQCSCSYTVEVPVGEAILTTEEGEVLGIVTDIQFELADEETNPAIFGTVSPDEVKDMINPSHYKRGGMEVIDVIDAFGLRADGYLWQVVKYILRCGEKDAPLQELKKAQWYLNRRIRLMEEELAQTDD